MYIEKVPNRNSPPCILLRESYRQEGKVHKRTLANLSKLPDDLIEGIGQLIKGGRVIEGNADTLAIADVPPQVIRTALRATRLIGRGLYGVDMKQSRNRCYVIEVNDNPNIDAGVEDSVLKNELYTRVMRYFLTAIEKRKAARPS